MKEFWNRAGGKLLIAAEVALGLIIVGLLFLQWLPAYIGVSGPGGQ